jgi:hypothetical protein
MRGEGVKNLFYLWKNNILLAKKNNFLSFVASFVETKFWGFSQKLIVLIVFEHFIKFWYHGCFNVLI